jgi:hypothetical protein
MAARCFSMAAFSSSSAEGGVVGAARGGAAGGAPAVEGEVVAGGVAAGGLAAGVAAAAGCGAGREDVGGAAFWASAAPASQSPRRPIIPWLIGRRRHEL